MALAPTTSPAVAVVPDVAVESTREPPFGESPARSIPRAIWSRMLTRLYPSPLLARYDRYTSGTGMVRITSHVARATGGSGRLRNCPGSRSFGNATSKLLQRTSAVSRSMIAQ